MKEKITISSWINARLAQGSYSFSLEQLRAELPDSSDVALKRGLARLSGQHTVISMYRGFYIIIPPQYQSMGVLPPIMFMDDLMRSLKRPYYMSLLTAASLHGAAHQQPQSHFVCTTMPSMRDIVKKGIHIQYISKRQWVDDHIISKKTETGYVQVSDPILTCLDLINYRKTVGGHQRVTMIIEELTEEVSLSSIDTALLHLAPISDLQRLGFIWDEITKDKDHADTLYDLMKEHGLNIRSTKLVSNRDKGECLSPNRWKIHPNIHITIDL